MFSMIPNRTFRPVAHRGAFDDFASDFFRSFFEEGFNGLARAERAMKVDIRDDGDRFTLQADLPGVERDNLKVEVADGVLTISAQYDQSHEDKDENGRYVCRERRSGSISRAFGVEGINEEDITAEFKDGVLTLTLPKRQEAPAPEAHTIEIH